MRSGLESPTDLVLRAWDLLRAQGWKPSRPRPLLHEALAAIGAFRVRPAFGHPPGW